MAHHMSGGGGQGGGIDSIAPRVGTLTAGLTIFGWIGTLFVIRKHPTLLRRAVVWSMALTVLSMIVPLSGTVIAWTVIILAFCIASPDGPEATRVREEAAAKKAARTTQTDTRPFAPRKKENRA